MTTDIIRKTADERKEALARTIANQVASGARVESQSDYQAVLVKGGKINHILHLILTVLTAGFWVIVWVALALLGGEKRSIVACDEWGNVSISKA